MNYILDEKLLHQKYFEDISKIPHGSYNEKELSDYLVEFAKNLSLKVKQDKMGNVIVYKEASKGYENHPIIILQSHIDMVCEKNACSNHNFLTDPIALYIEDGYVKAKETTLGADDAYGVAYMMAILEDNKLLHPPLECVFTVCEEMGLLGVQELKKEDLQGKKLINLDNGNDLYTYVSCAGGVRFAFSKEMAMESCSNPVYKFEVNGLYGGHSGGAIHQERGNSNKIASRVLYHLNKKFGINLIDINGGLKDNAIPRECVVIFSSQGNKDEIIELVKLQEEIIRRELEFSDSGLSISISEEIATKMCAKKISDEIVTMFYLLPNGFEHRNLHLETTSASQNFGVIETENNIVKGAYTFRGALDSYLDEEQEIIINFCDIFGFQWECVSRHPTWEYEANSSMRETLKKVYRDFYKREMIERATHGSLECGVFKKIIPDIDIVTIGPECYDAHTTTERMNLKSFDDTYLVLVKFLENL